MAEGHGKSLGAAVFSNRVSRKMAFGLWHEGWRGQRRQEHGVEMSIAADVMSAAETRSEVEATMLMTNRSEALVRVVRGRAAAR
jgi:hypothetical protein